jgi:hypothetical protein
MVLKYFYVYSFKKLCTMFPTLKMCEQSPEICGGWTSVMKEYTGMAYQIEHALGNTYRLTACPYLWDARLGKVLEVEDSTTHCFGHPFLVRHKFKLGAYYISGTPEYDMVGQIINITLSPVANEKQQLHTLFQSCKK